MGFETKHKVRDKEIPLLRKKLMKAIEDDFLQDENVLCLYYGGSIGNQNTDLFSDIDLRIVVKDEVFEQYRLDKKQRAQRWGTVLFYEDFPWASHSVAHFMGFIKVDSFYYKKKDIQPSVWLKNLKIIHDTNGFINDIHRKSQYLKYEQTFQEFEIWRNKFFANAHELYRGVMKREYYYALSCLDTLRLFIANGWLMEAGLQPNNPAYWAKLEGKRSPLNDWQLSLLESWNSSRDPEEIMDSMRSMIPEFLRIHKVFCGRFGFEEDRNKIAVILGMVI